MWLLTFALLILLGLLGIADWLKARRPDAGRHLQPIEPFEGLVGAAGIVWGLLLVLHWLATAGLLRFAPGAMLVKLILALVVLALSLILALPLLRSLFGEGDFIARLSRVIDRMAPYKLGLGFACLVLALYSLVGHAF
ncbi:MAG TPA: hypothetical protein VHE32_08965 [Rhodanobacteraceae bacterium]|jgi:hypothetical protein|nr:hypothetical protein [Rhodanobacteraceae bacterium]